MNNIGRLGNFSQRKANRHTKCDTQLCNYINSNYLSHFAIFDVELHDF